MKKIIFKVNGMHCASCAGSIEKSVKKVEGVKDVSVNFATNKLYIEADDGIKDEDIAEAVSRAGDYKAYPESQAYEESKQEGKEA